MPDPVTVFDAIHSLVCMASRLNEALCHWREALGEASEYEWYRRETGVGHRGLQMKVDKRFKEAWSIGRDLQEVTGVARREALVVACESLEGSAWSGCGTASGQLVQCVTLVWRELGAARRGMGIELLCKMSDQLDHLITVLKRRWDDVRGEAAIAAAALAAADESDAGGLVAKEWGRDDWVRLTDELIAECNANGMAGEGPGAAESGSPGKRSVSGGDDEGAGGETALVRGTKGHDQVIIDEGLFRVYWRGKWCDLKSGVAFRLFKRLNQSFGRYVSWPTLHVDVWHEKEVEKSAAERAASELRAVLRKAQIIDLVIDGTTNPGHYALKPMDPGRITSRQPKTKRRGVAGKNQQRISGR